MSQQRVDQYLGRAYCLTKVGGMIDPPRKAQSCPVGAACSRECSAWNGPRCEATPSPNVDKGLFHGKAGIRRCQHPGFAR